MSHTLSCSPTEPFQYDPHCPAIAFVSRRHFVCAGVHKHILRNLVEQNRRASQLLGQLAPFEYFRLALTVEGDCGALSSRLLAMAAALRVMPVDPPNSRTERFFKNAT